jgi:hypothetical protein
MMRDETAVFKPQEVANLMWAYARLEVELSSPELAAELAQAATTRVLSSLADTNGQHVANLLWACAKLEVAPEAADVHRLLHHLKNVQLEPQNTANAVYALAKLLNNGPAKDALRSQALFPQLLEVCFPISAHRDVSPCPRIDWTEIALAPPRRASPS